jgi:excinuclease ABC subunit A
MSIADFTALPVSKAVSAAEGIRLDGREQKIAGRILREVAERLGFP